MPQYSVRGVSAVGRMGGMPGGVLLARGGEGGGVGSYLCLF